MDVARPVLTTADRCLGHVGGAASCWTIRGGLSCARADVRDHTGPVVDPLSRARTCEHMGVPPRKHFALFLLGSSAAGAAVFSSFPEFSVGTRTALGVLASLCGGCLAVVAATPWNATRERSRPAHPRVVSVVRVAVALLAAVLMIFIAAEAPEPWGRVAHMPLYGSASLK